MISTPQYTTTTSEHLSGSGRSRLHAVSRAQARADHVKSHAGIDSVAAWPRVRDETSSCAAQIPVEDTPPATPRARVRRDLTQQDLAAVVALAADGDSRAWDELVRRFGRLVLATARKCGLSNDDAADVSQSVWFILFRHLKGIKDPAHLGGWLVTTTGREAVALSTRNRRERDINARCSELRGSIPAAPEDHVLTAERHQTVRRAVGRLGPARARLLELVSDGETSYASAAAGLGVAVGTIGPARQRLLRTLARSSELAAVR